MPLWPFSIAPAWRLPSKERRPPDRGGRAKVYCELTPAGKTALMKIQEVNAVMWKGSRKIEV